MSNDMVVTAPAVPVGNNDYSLNPSLSTHGSMVGGPPAWVARAMDLDTPAFYDMSASMIKGKVFL